MKINNNNTINFTSIYKMPRANYKSAEEFVKYVEPAYKFLKKDYAYMFLGSNPYEKALVESIDDGIRSQGYSYAWLRENMKNHNIHIPDFENTDMWVFSGEKDIMRLASFYEIQKRKTSGIAGLIHRVKKAFQNFAITNNKDIPHHLKAYIGIIEENALSEKLFNEVIGEIKPIEVKSNQDLLAKMLCERN